MECNRVSPALIFCVFLFGLFSLSCSRDEEINQELPSLKEGVVCYFYQISYVTDYDDARGYDSIFKIQPGLYTYKVITGRYLIDTIQLYKGSNNVYISKQRINPEYYASEDSATISWGKLFEMSYRKSKIVTSDSIVGEYYNTYGYNTSNRQLFRDSGIFAIKILH